MNTNTNYAGLYYTSMPKDVDLLEKNVQDYPASSVARFMLLYHLKKNNDPRFEELAKQAGVYLHNPYWMEFQLAKLQSGDLHTLVVEQEGAVSNEEDKKPEVSEMKEQDADTSVEKNDHQNRAGSSEITELQDDFPLSVVNEQIIENASLETEPAKIGNEENLNEPDEGNFNEEQNQLVEQETKEEDLPVAVNEQISENLPSEPVITENTNGELIEKTNEDAVLNNEMVEVADVEEPKENQITDEKSFEAKPEEKNETVLTADEEEADFNKDESVLNMKAPDEQENAPAEATDEMEETHNEDEELAIPFEPLHTVDYFASQGIRLTEDSLKNDQLGKQVKSFTAWLKSMKKLHPGQLPEQNEVIEKLIQTSSEVSNQHANVLTEAMAEVLVKQGKSEKAIEMYEKLSLLNPSKSPYFAAKIESLKTV